MPEAIDPPYSAYDAYGAPPDAETIPTDAETITPPYSAYGAYGARPDAETIPTEDDREVFEL